ncbi:MAG: alpha/beta hydrolase [Candidatus Omnitrophica bacterium]|nr:alpha/beta hydrolase [Candidatus Omnitrophota bacterium]
MIGCYSTFFSGTETAAAARFIKEQRLPDKKTAIGVLDELAALDLKDTLQKINIPTLIVHGEKDDVCPLGAGRFLHDNIKGSRLSVIEGAGHMPFYTRPEEFNRILEGFLSDAG